MTTRKVVHTAFENCLKAVNPRTAVRDAIPLLSLSNSSNFVIISFGKASIQMAFGAIDTLPATQIQKAIILAPESQKSDEIAQYQNFKDPAGIQNFQIFFGAKNNLPDEDSISATKHLIQEIQKLDTVSTVFLFLISGGGSALLALPKSPVKIEEKLEMIRIMQAAGATIQELNTVRQRISEVKGGKLLRYIEKGQSISLIISDVIGNPINLIASGPTVIPTGYSTPIPEILKKLKIEEEKIPESIRKVLQEPEDPIPNPPLPPRNLIISSNSIALQSLATSLQYSGLQTTIVTSELSGNAAQIGERFADLIGSDDPGAEPWLTTVPHLQYPLALIFGGETTVILPKNPGKGGRNQEMVLACLNRLRLKLQTTKIPHDFVFLSAGTDGQDGPTDAAGAIISSEDLELRNGPDPLEFLKNSDSYNFWKQFNGGNGHLGTGPSGTNVMDVQILVLDKKQK